MAFSEAIDEEQTTIRYRVGSGRERTFTFGTRSRVHGQCDNFRGNEYNCAYMPAAGERGLFKVRVSAYKDTSGNAGTAGRYNTQGIMVDTRAPAAPKLVLKNPASSPSGVARPEFTATLSDPGGYLYIWWDRAGCGTFDGDRGYREADVSTTTRPYTADIQSSSIRFRRRHLHLLRDADGRALQLQPLRGGAHL